MTDAPAFVYDPPATRVVFGAGSVATLGAELTRLGVRRALLISTEGRKRETLAVADGLAACEAREIFAGARSHVPAELVGSVREAAERIAADVYVTVGGGSTIGLAKALALERPAAIVAIPTTYSGSEMTPIWGITEERVKRTGRDPRVAPRLAIYDPLLTLGLPARVSAASGMNAIAHAVEALYAADRNPVVDWMAEEAIRALGEALPRVVADPSAVAPRTRALEGAWLAGTVLGATAMGLHHKLCHVLGGTFALPHAETHAVVLPYAAAYNAEAAPHAMRRIARALGARDAVEGLVELERVLPLPRSLAALGLRADQVPDAVRAAAGTPYANPRPVDEDGLRTLLRAAFEGAPPGR